VITCEELRLLNRRHLADELKHARVGWSFLSSCDAEQRRVIGRHLPLLFRALEEANEVRTEEPWDHLVPWGYFSAGLVRQAIDCALREAISPGLRELGIA
jgi:hypothetical protein